MADAPDALRGSASGNGNGSSNGDVAVVIPVYQEAEVIGSVVKGVLEHFPFVVCVDDGCSDGSAEQVALTAARLVRHPVNLGQGAALQTGIVYALAHPAVRYVVTFDADGQHRVEDALEMIADLRAGGVDIVFGSRFLDHRTQLSTPKRAVLKMAVHYTNLTSGVHLTDAHNGLRAFTRRVAELLDIRQDGMAHASEIVSQVGQHKLRFAEHPVQILYTDYSRSKGQSLLNSVNILFDLFFR